MYRATQNGRVSLFMLLSRAACAGSTGPPTLFMILPAVVLSLLVTCHVFIITSFT